MMALTGCARCTVSTEVNADGTWKRTVKLYATAAAKDAMSAPGTLDDTFALPKGPGWKVTRALDKICWAITAGQYPAIASTSAQALTTFAFIIAPSSIIYKDVGEGNATLVVKRRQLVGEGASRLNRLYRTCSNA